MHNLLFGTVILIVLIILAVVLGVALLVSSLLSKRHRPPTPDTPDVS